MMEQITSKDVEDLPPDLLYTLIKLNKKFVINSWNTDYDKGTVFIRSRKNGNSQNSPSLNRERYERLSDAQLSKGDARLHNWRNGQHRVSQFERVPRERVPLERVHLSEST